MTHGQIQIETTYGTSGYYKKADRGNTLYPIAVQTKKGEMWYKTNEIKKIMVDNIVMPTEKFCSLLHIPYTV